MRQLWYPVLHLALIEWTCVPALTTDSVCILHLRQRSRSIPCNIINAGRLAHLSILLSKIFILVWYCCHVFSYPYAASSLAILSKIDLFLATPSSSLCTLSWPHTLTRALVASFVQPAAIVTGRGVRDR